MANSDNDTGSNQVWPGANEQTPSRAQYFSWINNTNEGGTEAQTLVNLDFFRWLHDEYGMQLDIYAWDAGNLDGPRNDYGRFDSEKFRGQFPRGWKPIAESATEMDCRLGIWGGPDGFGDTPKEEEARIEQTVSLCRDLDFALFKIDGVCGTLRPEKQAAFARTMAACRAHCPDLILLNHRLELGTAKGHATTFLWEGRETYIDVHMANDCTAPHHRAGALARGLVPDLLRLTEDHGVCISSYVDFWDDDLVLQAFNRCLILAPEIYGNPWLMRDDEYPKLARIYNLHQRFRDILVHGTVLPEDQYGPCAVSRGNESIRFVTLRNLTWQPATISIRLDNTIGLAQTDLPVEVRRFHPGERIVGTFAFGDRADIEIPPFRACLLAVAAEDLGEVAVTGCDFEVERDTPGRPVVIRLLGQPGTQAQVSLHPADRTFGAASLDGENVSALLDGEELSVDFAGTPLGGPWHRELGELIPCPVPPDAEALYEATCFAADNNALEVRELQRSGPTQIPQVQAARDAFFDQELFVGRGIWDKYLFDGRLDTFFSVWHRHVRDYRVHGGALRIDLGTATALDGLVLRSLHADGLDNADPTPIPETLDAAVSDDLLNWTPVTFQRRATAPPATVDVLRIDNNGGLARPIAAQVETFVADLSAIGPIRYVRIPHAPDRVAELDGVYDGQAVDRSAWRASNLFAPFATMAPGAAWCASFSLGTPPQGSYLCVALEGTHGEEGAYAAARVGGRIVGAPDRAPAFPTNVWEAGYRRTNHHYTYYIPVTDDMRGEDVDVVVLGMKDGETDFVPRVWLTCHPPALVSRTLVLSADT